MEEYMNYFILSLFHGKEERPARLFHILTGKRTGSTYFQALRNDQLRFFGAFPRLNRQTYDQAFKKNKESGLIQSVDPQTMTLTDRGILEVEAYFTRAYYPSHLKANRLAKADRFYWQVVLLGIQVHSNYSFAEKAYRPVVKNIHIQNLFKKSLATHPLSSDTSQDLKGELTWLFQEMGNKRSTFLAQQLAGYERPGQTSSDLQERMDLTVEEYRVLLMDSLHLWIQILQDQPKKAPILWTWFKLVDKGTLQGLSRPSYQTRTLLDKGMTMEKIAQARRVKVNTIHDHMVEVACTDFNFDLMPLINPNSRQILDQVDDLESLTYKEFEALDLGIPFHDYRFMQIERLKHGKS